MSTGKKVEFTASTPLKDPGGDLFHRFAFFQIHQKDFSRALYFRGLSPNHNPEKTVLSTHFCETQPGIFRSPGRGSYGGLFSHRKATLDEIDSFVLQFEDSLVKSGAKESEIVCCPHVYDPEFLSLCYNVLLRHKYVVKRSELNYSIPIDQDSFLEKTDRTNRKRIRNAIENGVQTSLISPVDYRDAYQIIAENRKRRGYPITMTFDQLKVMFDKFPNDSKVFLTKNDQVNLAAAICFLVSPKILYVFYWGDTDGQSDVSPVSHLAHHLYEYCQKNQISVLDLGTSTVNGEPNFGLIQYKENLGSIVSNKFIFGKKYEQ